ncbi:MAG: adenylyl-sulfate kinase [Candidatus Delongbacteria bacterium]|nr:adenylyl-sulfate kinase [Candidatus Delongbacteria bacterium]MBN2835228.1 adenylyl-sulfate kinase [Candidatus Delongbacteria bacterium]
MSENIFLSKSYVPQKLKEKLLNQKAVTLWMTGLSGSGKSTLAFALEQKLFEMNYLSIVLDGDNLRHGLCSDLGFSESDRMENIRRVAQTAKLFNQNGVIVIVSLISPLTIGRENARNIIGDNFYEIYVNADLEVCISRDTKGLYRKAINGEIDSFTGVSAPYEEPKNPDLVLNTNNTSLKENLDILLDFFLTIENKLG